MKGLQEDLKAGRFQPVYLLYGEEEYLKRQYKQKLRRALVPEDDTMNVAVYQGKINPGEIIDLAETLPFFAERRLILMEDSGMFQDSSKELADYMKQISPSACFVFVETEVDKRSKMYKAVKSAGRVVEFARQTDAVLTKWILSRIKRENKKITQRDMQRFLEKTGNDMENIEMELEKLLCYTLERDVITGEDVEAVCVTQTTGKIFEMVDNIAQKKQQEALELYYDLLALKEPPMRILFLIARQFRILLLAKELRKQGYDHKFVASKVGIPEFAVRKNLAQAESFSSKQLRQAVEECVQTEEDVKTGNLNDQMAVELLIVKYSG